MGTTDARTVDVAVIGAGIVGASVAYHLAQAGASVVLIDKALPGSGVTSTSFAWIGKPGAWVHVDASTPLRRRALDDWQRLTEELPDVSVRWNGSIVWQDEFLGGSEELNAGERIIDASRIQELEPTLRKPPAQALHTSTDGAIDPVAVTEALVRGARQHGADVRVGVAATALAVTDGKATGIHTSDGDVNARTVIIAAGADVPMLLAPLGVELPVHPSPALLFRFVAPPALVRTLTWSNDLEARQTSDGLLLVPVEHEGEASHDDLARTAARTIERIAGAFDVDAADLRLVDARIGMRPMPHDGMPLIGRLPNLDGIYVTVMHSGVTLAPVVGRLVAKELVHGIEIEELRALRPLRAHS